MEKCKCIKCYNDRRMAAAASLRGIILDYKQDDFRYACEICGNKRCPHHSDHNLACTGSNEPGQPGSVLK